MPFINIEGQLPQNITEILDNPINTYNNKILFLTGLFAVEEVSYLTGKSSFNNVTIGYIRRNKKVNIFLLDIPLLESLSRTYRDASSSLVEYGKEYSVNNLNSLEPESSWVEGVEGFGVKESFIIENS